MNTFYLEEVSDEFDILHLRRFAMPTSSLVTTCSRMTNRGTPQHPGSGIVIPDFIPVTPEEVHRKSMQNERVATRLRAVFDTRRSIVTTTHDQHHTMTSDSGHVAGKPTASVVGKRRSTLQGRLGHGRPVAAQGGSSDPSPSAGLGEMGRYSVIVTLFTRFNAAIAARRRSLNDAQTYSTSTERDSPSTQSALSSAQKERPQKDRKSTQTEQPCAPIGNTPARSCALL